MELLIHHAAHQRLGARIHAIAPRLQALVMAEDGTFTRAGAPVDPEPLAPDIAWMSIDLFRSPARRAFMNALLDSAALDWVQSAAAGLDAPVFRKLLERGVRLTNSDAQAPSIAEFVVGSVLAHLQDQPRRRALQAARQWQPFEFRELGRTHWLIVGYGSIGRETAQRLKAFGATVTGIRRRPAPDPHAERVDGLDALSTHLPEADVVLLACGLTDATRGLVDADFLTRMKPASVLVNVGRGALVDEPALLAALDRGVPEHAILDVFATEPLPESSPFWDHPRVLVAAHASSLTDGLSARGDALFLRNLRRYVADQPLYKQVGIDDL